MNNREINRLVAEKVMGWVQGKYAKELYYKKNNGQIHGAVKFVKDWSPATDIVDALQVAEKWRLYEIHKVDNKYICWIYDESNNEEIFYEAEAPTLPLAICLAALKAVGVEVSKNSKKLGEVL